MAQSVPTSCSFQCARCSKRKGGKSNMMSNCTKCGAMMYVMPAGRKTKTLCKNCEEESKKDKLTKLAFGFASGEKPPR